MPTIVLNSLFRRARFAIVFSILLALALSGCSLLNRWKTPVVKVNLPDFKSGDLVHTVVVLPYQNHAALAPAVVQSDLFTPMTNALSHECQSMRLLFPGTAGFPKSLAGVGATGSGAAGDLALAAMGRNRGISFFITMRLDDIRVESRRKGLFWFLFQRNHYYLALDLDVTIIDSETSAKLMDKTFTQETEIDEGDYEAYQSDPRQIPTDTDEALTQLANQTADAICDRLSNEPWIGFVTDVNGDLIRLSSGSRNGLRPGLKLSVYAGGKRMTGMDGRQYRVPGLKVGTLEIISTDSDDATGRYQGSVPAQPGDSVRLVG